MCCERLHTCNDGPDNPHPDGDWNLQEALHHDQSPKDDEQVVGLRLSLPCIGAFDTCPTLCMSIATLHIVKLLVKAGVRQLCATCLPLIKQ